jgi:hypothetical protein
MPQLVGVGDATMCAALGRRLAATWVQSQMRRRAVSRAAMQLAPRLPSISPDGSSARRAGDGALVTLMHSGCSSSY